MSNPINYNEIIYENNDIQIRKIAEWEDCYISLGQRRYPTRDPHELLTVRFIDYEKNKYRYKIAKVTDEGIIASEQYYDRVDDSDPWLYKVATDDKGYGFVDPDLNIVIQQKYPYIGHFNEGYAVAIKSDNTAVVLDEEGNEFPFQCEHKGTNYSAIGYCSGGLIRVSDCKDVDSEDVYKRFNSNISDDDCFDEYSWRRGNWGFVNTKGEEAIPPQYAYATDFMNGVAIVAKKIPWYDGRKCGVIDAKGNEVIPCIYDELYVFYTEDGGNCSNRYFRAKTDKGWGVVDIDGNFIFDPDVVDLEWDLSDDDCFAFRTDHLHHYGIYDPVGLYSILERRIIFQPQFDWIDFLDDGWMHVVAYDENLNRCVERIINKEGNQLFESDWSELSVKDDHYIVSMGEKVNDRWLRKYGVVDKDGNIIFTCKYFADIDGISYKQKKIIYIDPECDLYGLAGFDDTVYVSPTFKDLKWLCYFDLIRTGTGDKYDSLYGLLWHDGIEIFPMVYNSIDIRNEILITRDNFRNTIYKVDRKISSPSRTII